MNTLLGYSALASIVAALVFTHLAKRHITHVSGLAVIGMAIGCGLGGQYEVAYRWFCIGTLVTGVAGCLERFLNLPPKHEKDPASPTA